MSYLRFTPDEYRTLSSLRCRLLPGEHSLPAFKRLLVAALSEVCGELARRVAKPRRGEAELLYRHFHPRPAPASRHGLTEEEVQTLAEACVASPFPVRFVRPFQDTLVEWLEGARPELAGKVARMSGFQFERLYNNALGREQWDA